MSSGLSPTITISSPGLPPTSTTQRSRAPPGFDGASGELAALAEPFAGALAVFEDCTDRSLR
jgi:hypothetical protein